MIKGEDNIISKILMLFVAFTVFLCILAAVVLVMVTMIGERDSPRDLGDSSHRQNTKSSPHTYLLSEHNTETGESYFDIVTLDQELKENEVISYELENSHFLIHNFGETEYECSGYCYCEEDDSGMLLFDDEISRRIAHKWKYVIIFVVGCVSGIAAKFGFQCDKCPSGTSSKGVMEECKEVTYEETEKTTKVRYNCHGKCGLSDPFWQTFSSLIVEQHETDESNQENIDNALTFVESHVGDCDNMGLSKTIEQIDEESAFSTFETEYFHPYCSEVTKMSPGGEKEMFEGFSRSLVGTDAEGYEDYSYCAGRNSEWVGMIKEAVGFENVQDVPFIQCVPEKMVRSE